MPFVAGVDKYLPQAFGRIHPRYGSPYVAVSVQAVIASGFILMSFVGATVEEAYLTLLDTTLLVYFIPYVYMFAAYIALRRREFSAGDPQVPAGDPRVPPGDPQAPPGDSLAPLIQPAAIRRIPANHGLAIGFGVCGLLTTLLAMAVSMKPPAEANALLYEIKVLGGAGAFVLGGAIIYWLNRDRSRQTR
jgi:amino acid transporter